MIIPKVTDEVKNNKKVSFLRFENNELWYATESGFEFPISVEEAKGGAFHSEEKATLLMRWIRKRIQFLESAKEDSGKE